MPFYTGSTADGSDMKEVQGAYVSEDGKEWSSEMYPYQKRAINTKNEVLDYMNGRYTLRDVYNQIQNKTCELSSRLRKYVLDHFDNNGNFIIIESENEK